MANLTDLVPGRTYTYQRAISDPASNEQVNVQQWAWDAGFYATSGFTARDDPDARVGWFVTNTNGNVRKMVLKMLPDLSAQLLGLQTQVTALTAAVDGVDEQTVAGVLASVKEAILSAAPALAQAVAEELGDIAPETLSAAVEVAMRRVFASLGTPG